MDILPQFTNDYDEAESEDNAVVVLVGEYPKQLFGSLESDKSSDLENGDTLPPPEDNSFSFLHSSIVVFNNVIALAPNIFPYPEWEVKSNPHDWCHKNIVPQCPDAIPKTHLNWNFLMDQSLV